MSDNCLACGGMLGETIFKLNELPLVDSFCTTREKAIKIPSHDVNLKQCKTCETIQICSPPDTSKIYINYIYESSSSPDLSKHFEEYAEEIETEWENKKINILEIGANDGLLISHLLKKGYKSITAIDPSPQTKHLKLKDVRVINDFFEQKSFEEIENNSYNLIIANNCLSHIPHLTNCLSLCKKLLSTTGTLVVEVQSCLDLIEKVVFDYIYHEHYYYHTVNSFERITKLIGLEIYSVSHNPSKGGTYRFKIGKKGVHNRDHSVDYWKYREEISNVHTIKPWKLMEEYLEITKRKLNNYINNHSGDIVAYGASATGTVLLKYMNINKPFRCIIDDNPKRQGLFAPGSGIPIMSLESLRENDLCIVLAWRHKQYIIPKLEKLGIEYILPLPVYQKNK